MHEVRLQHEGELFALPGVVGVADAVTGGRAVIQVFVVPLPTGERVPVPAELEGFPVEVISTGTITRTFSAGRGLVAEVDVPRLRSSEG